MLFIYSTNRYKNEDLDSEVSARTKQYLDSAQFSNHKLYPSMVHHYNNVSSFSA